MTAVQQAGPLPYLKFCDVEVANGARTVEYLRNGLANDMQGHWELGPGEMCSVLYRLAGGDCVTPDVFVSPAADPAPWYDAGEPGSTSFLGLMMLKIDGYDSTVVRSVTQRLSGLDGGTFGPQHRVYRTWNFRAAMISADDAGAEYGLRWLTSVLAASACDTCETCDLTVRLVCPPAGCTDETLGEWISYDVALTSGPKEVQQRSPGAPDDALAGSRDLVIVEWTMVAGIPYLYKPAVPCLDVTIDQDLGCTDICDWLFGDPGDAVCCPVTPPQLGGTLGSVFSLSSVDGFGPLLLEAYEECPGSSSGSPTAALSIELSEVPAGATVVVDSALHRITVATVDPDTGETTIADGQYLVVLPEGQAIQWLEVRDCDAITCICVRASRPCSTGTLDVLLDTQIREG